MWFKQASWTFYNNNLYPSLLWCSRRRGQCNCNHKGVKIINISISACISSTCCRLVITRATLSELETKENIYNNKLFSTFSCLTHHQLWLVVSRETMAMITIYYTQFWFIILQCFAGSTLHLFLPMILL